MFVVVVVVHASHSKLMFGIKKVNGSNVFSFIMHCHVKDVFSESCMCFHGKFAWSECLCIIGKSYRHNQF